jgi:sialate O-acetylesterase
MRLGGLSLGLAVSLCAGLASTGAAQTPPPLLAPVFQDHAVLQRGKPLPVFGKAAAGETVTVRLGGHSQSAVAGFDGRWSVTLPALAPGAPLVLEATSAGRSQTVDDLLVGDVWLCSGQSNMEMPTSRVINGAAEAVASANDQIRLLQIPRAGAATPRDAFGEPTTWTLAGPASVAEFSAACYFFGRELQRTSKVPIGLIHPSWGGTAIQAWMSRTALSKFDAYREPLRILAGHAADPARAEVDWRRAQEAWWTAHLPAPVGKPWSAPDLDDSGWATIRPTTQWEGLGIPELAAFDGTVWMRTTVEVTAAQAAAGGELAYGPVDDIDATFVNGVLVGGTEGWDVPRRYAVPPGLLKPGRNVVAVRVFDGGAGGGPWGPAEKRGITFKDGGFAQLDPEWRWRIAAPLSATGSPPYAPWIANSGLSTLYNGMVAPLGPYALKGFTWYQGEANVHEADAYARLLPAMIAEWRTRFGAPDAPFLVVQLADFGPYAAKPVNSQWAALRDAQRRVVEADAHAGLAVAIDLGDRFDIHPTNKQEVARRLALHARRLDGETVEAFSPSPASATRAPGAVRVAFAHAEGGLVIYGGNRPVGFELCDAAACRFVDALADGEGVTIVVPEGMSPTRVRYAWADSPIVNLYNRAGLPATPFEIPLP